MANLAHQGVARVHLLLSTPGGGAMHGITLYNTLRGFPFELITHNVGCVNSIGNAVFLAGGKRYACPRSTFMFHGVGFDVTGTIRLEEKLLLESSTPYGPIRSSSLTSSRTAQS
jgi:ATP-dependent protease ClpP protease subunit